VKIHQIYCFAALVAGLFVATSFATPLSAKRLVGESYNAAVRRVFTRGDWEKGTAAAIAGPVSEAEWSLAPTLSSDANLVFRTMRDLRFLVDGDDPYFPRRVSWMYPRDGCYARAAGVLALADRMHVERPAQLFAFGELSVETPNVAEGSVQWWYHVTPIYRDRSNGLVYAFDPSIEPSRPLPVDEWLKRMVPSLSFVRVVVCAPNTVEPNVDCLSGGSNVPEKFLALLRDQFLPQEWNNLASMGRDPYRELGEEPPWLSGDIRQ